MCGRDENDGKAVSYVRVLKVDEQYEIATRVCKRCCRIISRNNPYIPLTPSD